MNFRSLLPVQDAVLDMMDMCNADMLFGTETWLTEDIPSSRLFLNRSFVIHRKDRRSKRGVGVLLAVHTRFNSLSLPVVTDLEVIFAKVDVGHLSFIAAVCYRPPDANADLIKSLVLVSLRSPPDTRGKCCYWQGISIFLELTGRRLK